MKKSDTKIAQYHLHRANPEKLQFELYDLNTYRRESGDNAASPHSHSYYQIIWFRSAGGTHTVDFKTFPVNSNTVLFISKNHIHAFDNNLDIEGWLIHFNESFFMHSDVDIFLKYNIFNSIQRPIYTINDYTAEIGSAYIGLIQKELYQKHSFGYGEVIRFLLKSFLINLERLHRADAMKTLAFNNRYELKFYEFKDLIDDNYENGWSLSDYAGVLNVSTKTLATITKSIIDKSPSQLISDRVVLEAKRLLKFTSLQIGEVAFKIGFDDASYFVKYFKRYVGQSPKNYRDGQND